MLRHPTDLKIRTWFHEQGLGFRNSERAGCCPTRACGCPPPLFNYWSCGVAAQGGAHEGMVLPAAFVQLLFVWRCRLWALLMDSAVMPGFPHSGSQVRQRPEHRFAIEVSMSFIVMSDIGFIKSQNNFETSDSYDHSKTPDNKGTKLGPDSLAQHFGLGLEEDADRPPGPGRDRHRSFSSGDRPNGCWETGPGRP